VLIGITKIMIGIQVEVRSI